MTHDEDVAALLTGERARTQDLLSSLTADLAALIEASRSDNADDEHDPEGATIAFERAQLATMIGDGRRRLAEIDRAVSRLGDGNYGVCELCGQPIGLDRLAARPATTRCVSCAAGAGRR